MKTFALNEQLIFDSDRAYAQSLLADNQYRILRFMLQPGQKVREHKAPSSAVILVVIQGQGLFSGADGQQKRLSAQDLVIYDQGEPHAIEALDQELVFLAILTAAPDQAADHPAGLMA